MPSVNMAYYISTQTIEAVHAALEIPLRGGGRGGGEGGGERASDDESIGEGIDDKY